MNHLLDTYLNQLASSRVEHTETDKEVWSRLISSLIKLRQENTAWFLESYLSEVNRFALTTDSIPTLENINHILQNVGWRAVYVDNMVSGELYIEMQANNILPMSCKIRKLPDLYYAASPDFIHDLVGHVFMLFDENYRELTERWATKTSQVKPSEIDIEISNAIYAVVEASSCDLIDPDEIRVRRANLLRLQELGNRQKTQFSLLNRFYAWVMEFGCVKISGNYKLIGTAILSSLSEQKRIFKREVEFVSFREEALAMPIDYSRIQDKFFIADSFDEYFEVLERI